MNILKSIISFVLIIFSPPSFACSCERYDAEKIYTFNDQIIIIKIDRGIKNILTSAYASMPEIKKFDDISYKINGAKYDVEVIELIKGTYKINSLHTPQDSTCSISPELGGIYIFYYNEKYGSAASICNMLPLKNLDSNLNESYNKLIKIKNFYSNNSQNEHKNKEWRPLDRRHSKLKNISRSIYYAHNKITNLGARVHEVWVLSNLAKMKTYDSNRHLHLDEYKSIVNRVLIDCRNNIYTSTAELRFKEHNAKGGLIYGSGMAHPAYHVWLPIQSQLPEKNIANKICDKN